MLPREELLDKLVDVNFIPIWQLMLDLDINLNFLRENIWKPALEKTGLAAKRGPRGPHKPK